MKSGRIKIHAGSMAITCVAFAVLAMPLPAVAATPGETEARLERLEQRWDKLEAELAALREELRAAKGATAVAPAVPGIEQRVHSVEQSVSLIKTSLEAVATDVGRQEAVLNASSEAESRSPKLSVYGTLAFNDFADNVSAFDATSFEVVISGQPSDRISFFSELEFERAASVGGRRGGEVLLEQAYVDFNIGAHAAFRAGVLLMPFGNKAIDHFSPVREVVSQPLSAYALAPSDWADNGVGLVGDFSLSDKWTVDFTAYLAAGLDDQVGEYGFRRGQQSFGVDNNDNKAFIGRIAFNHREGSSLGLAAYRGAYDSNGDLFINGFGLDGLLQLGRWHWTGEYLQMSLERPDGSTSESFGGYIRTIYDVDPGLTGKWFGAPGKEFALSLIHEYDYVRLSSLLDVAAPSSREWKHVFGVLLSFRHSWILKVNREMSGYANVPVVNGDADGWLMSIGYVF